MQIIKQVYLPEEPFWGLGDSLRGFFSLANFCRQFGFSLEYDYSLHPISEFLSNPHRTPIPFTKDQVVIYHIEDLEKLAHTLNSLRCIEEPFVYNLSTNCFYLEAGVAPETRTLLRSSLVPKPVLEDRVSSQLKTMGLESAFAVVHIRMGDAFLLEGQTNETEYARIAEAISKCPTDLPLVVFSDDAGLKTFLSVRGFLVSPTIPCHLSSSVSSQRILETLTDFFCISKASHIYTISKHSYGSGFVDWCAELFEIPTSSLDVDLVRICHF